MKCTNIILILLILFFYFFFCDSKKNKENYALSDLVDLPSEGIVYSIVNNNNKELISSAFTPIMCDNNILTNSSQFIPSDFKGWSLKNISKGIYIFEKPSKNECLYTHSTMNSNDSLRSYVIEGTCQKKNLCGSSEEDYTNHLDEQSLRTYFRIIKDGDKFNIISVKNNQLICINDNGVSFKSTADDSCKFSFNKI